MQHDRDYRSLGGLELMKEIPEKSHTEPSASPKVVQTELYRNPIAPRRSSTACPAINTQRQFIASGLDPNVEKCVKESSVERPWPRPERPQRKRVGVPVDTVPV